MCTVCVLCRFTFVDCTMKVLFVDVACQTTVMVSSIVDADDRRTEDDIALGAPCCSEQCVLDDKTLSEDDITADFPSLSAAASYREKKHESLSASVARKLRLCRTHDSNSVSSHQCLEENKSQLETANDSPETPESIPACTTFLGYHPLALPTPNGSTCVWKELRRKSSSSDSDVAVPHRPMISADRELERPVTGIGSAHAGKQLKSVDLVLADFLNPGPSASENLSPEFVPMLFCTLCGERTHSVQNCARQLGETFYE